MEPKLDADEFLEVVKMPYADLMRDVITGEVCDAKPRRLSSKRIICCSTRKRNKGRIYPHYYQYLVDNFPARQADTAVAQKG